MGKSQAGRFVALGSAIGLAASCFTGCGEKDSEARYSRVPGLEGEQSRVAANASKGAAGDVNAASLNPGMPAHGGDASSTSGMTGSMPGGIAAPPVTKVLTGGNKLQVAGIAFTVSDDWKNVPPASKLRSAQYALPGPGGDAELTVFYFGPGQGGSVQNNINRWVGQFKSDDPTTDSVPLDVGQLVQDTLQVTMVKVQGTYDPGTMPGMPDPGGPKPKYALFGIVVDGGPEGPLFVKTTGPKATLDAQNANLEAFAKSAKVSTFK